VVGWPRKLRELMRTNDLVHLSWVQSVLDEANILTFIMDEHMSILEGSANAIPRRVMVSEEDHELAQKIIEEAKSDLNS
jgi:hypothetical protein